MRARLQPHLLQPRPGLGRHPDLRAEQPQHRRLQLGHARRRRALPVGRPVDDGHAARAARTTTSFYDNDFSFAPTNGIEATFSRNVFYGNRVEECWHGLWGGYSFDSWIAANRFARNVEAIAIEHGQDNRITENTLRRRRDGDPPLEERDAGSRLGISRSGATRAAATTSSPATRSVGNPTALKIAETQNVRVLTNAFEKVGTVAALVRRHAELRHRRRGRACRSGRGRRSTSRCRSRCPAAWTRRFPTPSGAAATPSSSTSGVRTTGSRRSCGPTGRSDATPAEAARARSAGRVEGRLGPRRDRRSRRRPRARRADRDALVGQGPAAAAPVKVRSTSTCG